VARSRLSAGLERTQRRQVERDAPTDLATRDAQLAPITAWGIPDASMLNRLAGIIQPTFVAVDNNDTMMHTKNSQLLSERLPNPHLRIYGDANHGFLNQYPELFADHVKAFLNAQESSIGGDLPVRGSPSGPVPGTSRATTTRPSASPGRRARRDLDRHCRLLRPGVGGVSSARPDEEGRAPPTRTCQRQPSPSFLNELSGWMPRT
jgi:hypothetical protein